MISWLLVFSGDTLVPGSQIVLISEQKYFFNILEQLLCCNGIYD